MRSVITHSPTRTASSAPAARRIRRATPCPSAERTGSVATASSDAPPIVFVVFDGLSLASLLDSSGAVDAARYPSFARLARTSTWYRDTTTVADVTQLAIPAILTGRYPRPSRQVPTAADHPHSLFTLLAGRYVRP